MFFLYEVWIMVCLVSGYVLDEWIECVGLWCIDFLCLGGFQFNGWCIWLCGINWY